MQKNGSTAPHADDSTSHCPVTAGSDGDCPGNSKITMKNYTTPRTLAECQFTTGYPSMAYRVTTTERIKDYALALVIGVGLAAALFYGWSA